MQFEASAIDDDGNQLGGRVVVWSVDDESIAVVHEGMVSGVNPGSTMVRASSEGISSAAQVTVLQAPTVGTTTSSVSFSGSSNGPSPSPVAMAVFNDGSGALTGLDATVTYGEGPEGWLVASLAATTAPTTLRLTVDGDGLAPGTHVAVVEIVSDQGSTNRLTVTFEVGDSSPIIGLSSTAVQFTLMAGTSSSIETVQVTNLGGQSLTGLGAGISYPSGIPNGWLTASLSPTVAPAELFLSANAAGLPPGSYTAEVSVSGNGALNSPSTVLVALVVSEPRPRIRLSTESLTFSAKKDSDPPGPQVVEITNGGGGSLAGLTLAVDYVSTESDWLAVSLDRSTAPAFFTVAVDHRDLAPGAYLADVRVASPDAENSPAALGVLLLVADAPPFITVTPSDVQVTAVLGQSDPAPVTVVVGNGGGGTLVGLTASVTYANGQPPGWLAATLAGTAAPTTLQLLASAAGLSAGSYSATVEVASSQAGVGPNYVTVGLTVGTPPAPPSALAATLNSATSVELTWSDESDDEDSFSLERRSDGSAWASVATLDPNVEVFADLGLSPGTTYEYRIRACLGGVCSEPSNIATASTPAAATPPTAPTDLAASAVAQGTIELTWIDTSENESGFEIERSSDAGATWGTLAQPGPNATAFSDTSLPPSTSFAYRIRSCNDLGCSDWAAVASATTLAPPTPPAPPTALLATVASHEEVDLAWTDASDDEDAFEVERSTDAGVSWAALATIGPNSTAYVDGSVVPETQYLYRVRACVTAVCSAYSNVAAASTPAAPTPPLAPSGLGATTVSRSRIDLAWTDNSDDETGFEVEWRRGSGSWDAQALGPNETSLSVTGLRRNTTYEFRLRACNDAGCSAWIGVTGKTGK